MIRDVAGAAGGPVDFEEWYARERPRLFAVLCAMLGGDRSTAADLADETCARVYERWDRVGRMESPGGWAYRVATNLARRQIRRGHREQERRRLAAPRTPNTTSDWSLEVREAVESLPPRERTAILLRYVADLTQDQVAQAMRVTPGTAAASLHAARQKLAHLLVDADTHPVEGEVPHE